MYHRPKGYQREGVECMYRLCARLDQATVVKAVMLGLITLSTVVFFRLNYNVLSLSMLTVVKRLHC